MSRELKFRAWSTPFGDFDGYSCEPHMATQGEPDIETLESFMFHYADEKNLMLFTGLKDKNGKDIYEGDIIRRYTGYVFEQKVRWYSLGSANHAKAYGYDWHEDDEIIGNIWETPHLLNSVLNVKEP